MKHVLSLVCLVSIGLVVTLGAQAKVVIATDADYATHMKEIGQMNGVLTKSIKGGTADEAGKAAARMEVLFKNVHAYWNDKKVADATAAAQTALTSLQAIQKAIAANDMTAAETARGTLAGACMGCHKEHREKLPEGGFKIK